MSAIMAKRDLFKELMEGFDVLKTEREGKITLRTSEIDIPKPIEMSPNQIARSKATAKKEVAARVAKKKVAARAVFDQ